MVRIQGVDKYFGDHQVLHHVDLDVAAAEVVAVVGPSGSGKSTLCRCVNGLERPDRGSVLVDGVTQPAEGRELARFRADTGMVFQSFNLFGHLTVEQNITLAPLRVRGVSRAQARDRAAELLERVGLAAKARAHPAQLSGGQQQRVAIARALAMDPKVLLCDEPTSALDPEMVQEVLDVLAAVAAAGTAMIVVTHEMAFAREVADRVAFMDGGRLLEEASPDAFFTAPRHPRAAEFLSKVLRR
ncbi:amino acid ABC transporter ATP-binding protein (plasmid) [Streptomyces mirabilis]|uniref:Amino acid ABC transporter ATP-binding protein n=1 Tax=Streptomyces mirabilis TaxID=68239 RepID=A0ABU3V593_9ACTN|nr:amino acid ABC transporter ATP-binding protein [Streptomyces mirabilis]MCX5355698.1 amino acid ABC transporter ATP-binding protein [Streptomyces mirabilis]MDU9001341.1 amino acid ABC transporter ATP-binding protein [Streptomyces mirabilis]